MLNINLTAPHRLYRDQLERTFVQTSKEDVEPVSLSEINPANSAPYHLINATVNLPSSTDVALRERKSDFFLFSKYWCGAPSIGYVKTSEWQAGRIPIDLATAMAVSGAAASSYMGLGSIASLSALLTFLNVRLGYWILQPKKMRRLQFKTPGFLCLIREMTGIAMSEKRAWINLSDGGHIENMALYELLRRRCKFIISIDGEADPQSTFHGHLTLVRHALIDFGFESTRPNRPSARPHLEVQSGAQHDVPGALSSYCQSSLWPGPNPLPETVHHRKWSSRRSSAIGSCIRIFPIRRLSISSSTRSNSKLTVNWVFTSPRVYLRGRYCMTETSQTP